MKLNENFGYRFVNKPNLNFNHLILSKIYMPMLNSQAFSLYYYLLSELQSSFIIYSENKIGNILKTLNLSQDNFETARKNLESLNLIQTFFDSNSNSVYFEIFSPLNFETFILNKKLLSILINLIGQREFDKLELIFGESKPLPNYANVSEKLDVFFPNEKADTIYSFDFEDIYRRLSKTTSLNVYFSDKSKKIIDSYYLEYKLSLNEIEKCLYDSIIKKDDILHVCDNLLEMQLSSLISNSKNIAIFNKTKINRNKNIFIEKSSISSLHAIFNDYRKFGSEQYFSSITKDDISDEEKNIFAKLRNKFNLPDILINVMVDYSLNKTYGKLNEKYLLKVAKSFNASSISTIEEAYDYLTNNFSNKNPINTNSNTKINLNNNENECSLIKDNFELIDDEIVEIEW